MKNQKQEYTVANLRQKNFKVRVLQRRYAMDDTKFTTLLPLRDLPGPQRSHKAGELLVEVTTPEGIELSGKAVCSKKDSFNRKLALRMALGRALIDYQVG
jgi:hypothetical protein